MATMESKEVKEKEEKIMSQGTGLTECQYKILYITKRLFEISEEIDELRGSAECGEYEENKEDGNDYMWHLYIGKEIAYKVCYGEIQRLLGEIFKNI